MPAPPSATGPGPSKNALNRRFISPCSEDSSRMGSQRISAMRCLLSLDRSKRLRLRFYIGRFTRSSSEQTAKIGQGSGWRVVETAVEEREEAGKMVVDGHRRSSRQRVGTHRP